MHYGVLKVPHARKTYQVYRIDPHTQGGANRERWLNIEILCHM